MRNKWILKNARPLRTKAKVNHDREAPAAEPPVQNVEALLQELHVHQIELEMQNNELRSAYEALEASRDRYVDLYEFAPVGYLTLSKDSLITEINLTACKILGMERRELIQRRFASFVEDTEKDRWYRLFHQIMKDTAGNKHSFDLKMQSPDHSTMCIHVDCQRKTERMASSVLLIAIFDITESKMNAQKLSIANQRKDEFLAMLAHELRNPLTPIRNMVQLLKIKKINDPLIERAYQVIDRQVSHMTRLLDDLLDLARIMHNKISLKLEPIKLTDLINHAIESSLPLIESKHQALVISHAAVSPWVKGDSIRLSQVITNLLDNASKYTKPGGKITLSTVVEGATVILKIQDTGIGILPEMLPDIFDLFVQVDQSLDHSNGGLGIGLTLARQLVEKHGGTITAESPGSGQGSLFSVRLPRILSDFSIIKSKVIEASPSKYRILIVDDYADAIESLKLILEAEGHQVELANCGMKAIELAKNHTPDVVLLDIGLPDMSGYEVAKTLRSLPETQYTMLIALTGYGQQCNIKQAKIAVFDHYLLKPLDFEALSEILLSLKK